VISESWWKGFYKRHSNISLRTPEALNRLSAVASNREVVESVFTLFSTLIEKYGINVRDVWNCDEIGFSLGDNGKQIKVLARRGSRNVYQQAPENGGHVTVLVAANAEGSIMPPLFIFKGVYFPHDILSEAPANSSVAMSTNGWIETQVFEEWFFN
jgi:hypothetical protein